MQNRRTFLKNSSRTALGLSLLGMAACSSNETQKPEMTEEKIPEPPKEKALFFQLSLAQWSLHKTLFGGKLDNLDFPAKAKELGFTGIEWVGGFFKDKVEDKEYLAKMKANAEQAGVQNLLIMIDEEGDLSITDDAEREKSVANHFKWVDAAAYLGCHSIRVNLFGTNDPMEWHKASVASLNKLATYAAIKGINVLVENHGGLSSDGEKLAAVMKEVKKPNCGTLPDFGNFCIEREGGKRWEGACINEYDRYKGINEMMPYAKGVSAKSYVFDAEGNEMKTDYAKMLKIVHSHGFGGFIGVEYEGTELSEEEGIIATRDLLMREGKI